ncbi:MAG: DEAD/DEAH box helicase [Vicinamibacterales bacterium]
MVSTRARSTDGFTTLGLSPALITALTALGYEEPTPVQRETIPLILEGKDLLAQAATGTGKTAAFALPMIQLLSADTPPRKGAAHGAVQAVVLVPTRELAMQVSEAIHKYSRGSSLDVVPLYGGSSMEQQIRALKRGVDIVVATPGRALDHLRRKTLALDDVRLMILDEADEMLDMGFADDIEAILEQTPESRQTALFSATMPQRILKIAQRHLQSPARVTIAHEKTAAGKLPRVRQVAYIVRRNQKAQALDRVLDMESPSSAIVFCRTRIEVDTLVETLNAHGYKAEALHGGMMQRQRDAVMNKFRAAKTDLLIATDVAARGLDIEHLSHVFNYDLPAEAESYVHRIGRTGRAGREGTAITFAEPREHRLLKNIEFLTKQKIEIANLPTVADLRSRRLELTKAALREKLVEGGFDDVRVVVESLADEFDVLDIAAAAVKMAQGEEAPEEEIAAPEAPGTRHQARSPRLNAQGSMPKAQRGDDGATVRLFIGAGRRDRIRPGDLVGAITGEAGVPAHSLGAIQIADGFSLIEVPELLADQIINAMRGALLRGKKVPVRRDRDHG